MGKWCRWLLSSRCGHASGQHVKYNSNFSRHSDGLAQCHNHPFDRWTQMEYYQMASYTYGIHSSKGETFKAKSGNTLKAKPKGFPKRKTRKAQSREAQALRRSIQEMIRPLGTERLIRIANLVCLTTISTMMESPGHWSLRPLSSIILFQKKKVSPKYMPTVNG